MKRITIDKKKYVLIPEKDFEALLVKAARKTKPVKKLSLAAGKKLAHDWIENRAKEK